MGTHYQVSESAVYRPVSEKELMVIQVESGKISYYSAETESFLDFFRSPKALSEYLELAHFGEEPSERAAVLAAFQALVDAEILIQAGDGPEKVTSADGRKIQRAVPRFLRHSEKTLGEISVVLASTSLTVG